LVLLGLAAHMPMLQGVVMAAIHQCLVMVYLPIQAPPLQTLLSLMAVVVVVLMMVLTVVVPA
jgi:hypothetical protein